MRPRSVGGYEPDDDDQRELVELWQVSRCALSGAWPAGTDAVTQRSARIDWCVAAFCKTHANEPGVAHKWVYVWAVENLGRLFPGAPISVARKRRRS